MVSPSKTNTSNQLTVPRISKSRAKKRTGNTKDNKTPGDDNNNQNGGRSSSSGRSCGGGGGAEEASRAQGEEGGTSSGGAENTDSVHGGGSGPQQRTAKEKAQIRRAQVRRAQIQHRKRKADYMRQLELDIDMLRDLISAAEQDMRTVQKDNEAIRVQLGVVHMIRNDRGVVNVGGGVVGVAPEGVGGGAGGGRGIDTIMTGVPQLSITPAPAVQLRAESTAAAATNSVDNVAASLSPLSISSTDGSAFPSTTATSPGGTVSSGLEPSSNIDSPTSIFDGIDLDDITVSIVMDEAIGNPVYQISPFDPKASSAATATPEFDPSLTDKNSSGFPEAPIAAVSPLDPGFTPNFYTDLAAAPIDSTALAGRGPSQFSATTYILPNLTVAQTHQVVNFVLALEHVCWGHAGHQFHEPDAEICADTGHALMATNLFLREAPSDVFSSIETSAKDMTAFITNTEPENPASTANHMDAHRASQGLTWQAPDVTLQTLYGLAVSLNPISEMELAPVQAWFELAARYPLSILLRVDILNALKREFVGVVRCLYFGAVMEREAFESVVQRVVDPVMAIEEKDCAVHSFIGAAPTVAAPATVSPKDLTIGAPTIEDHDFATVR
ncbi:hypothetical protein HMPREF1624_06150 [Sporothrix schenckii ATCC 58251]|uniref:BZIP domain-containing protein n=1 Tax=Sporothrix schenckii (strain ATCC 58251 / de Perez 2211183) TaxID=1391915 RepID=U7PQR7_SPOS1|nr:hypothetical protein HMPREF1624_06150 [Sporothrix schenckii ATCC 58251]